MTNTSRLPLGIRMNNPGNIRATNTAWLGETPHTGPYEAFETPLLGLRAMMRLLINYKRKHGLDTVLAIVNRWAPPSENDTGAYQDAVAERLNVKVDDPLQIDSIAILPRLAAAMVVQENGYAPRGYPPVWYSSELYHEAARLALGLQSSKKAAGQAPSKTNQGEIYND